MPNKNHDSSSNHLQPFTLRPYQQEAVDATLQHFRHSNAPAVITLPTGAGKSLVIAELAKLARRKILVLAHVKELVDQNHRKYQSYGKAGSIFSAGLNQKEIQQQVVFGSVQSVSRNLELFSREFSLLIIDECHRVSLEEDSQYQQVISTLKASNPDLKVLGLTATPYRLGSGWIFQHHLPQRRTVSEDDTAFDCCIYELSLEYMISNNYLSPVELMDAPVAFYDFEKLRPSSSGHYRESELNQVLNRSKRATVKIIEQVVSLSKDRQGIMIFAATVDHAREIMSYLPGENSALILGNMKEQARDSVILAFKDKQIKFLVNVAVLTTGFDAPHVDVIVLLRPTESVSLYQQIIGRGLRLSPDKDDCLVLDYANNKHRLFAPEVGSSKPSSDSVQVEIPCPKCQHRNVFWGKTDEADNLLEHFGRRCQGITLLSDNHAIERCDFRFRFKECTQCGAENDIAARQCQQCQHKLVDPDDRLKEALNLRNHIVLRCSGILLELTGVRGMPSAQTKTRDNANDVIHGLRITYFDEDGACVNETFKLETQAQKYACWHNFVRLHLINPNDHNRFTAQTINAALLEKNQELFRHPDFVIARQEKYYNKITEKLFDYEGRYRRANEIKDKT